MIQWIVKEIRDKTKLWDFLSKDRGLAVYFIGDLSQEYFAKTRWFAAENDQGSVAALALLYNHPSYPTILTLGNADGIDAVIQQYTPLWPQRFHCHHLPEHTVAFQNHYTMSDTAQFLRMVLPGKDVTYHNAEVSLENIRTLRPDDEQVIGQLLEYYPESFFSIKDTETGF